MNRLLLQTVRFFFLPSLLIPASIFSASYFIASNGDDSRTPTQARNQATPWQTLAKVSAAAFQPGDSVLFKRGDVWYGTLTVSSSGVAGNPVVYAAFGAGANPQIKGTRLVTGIWSVHSGNIWRIDLPDTVISLFLDGQPLPLARHPNTGYLTIDSVPDTVTFRCNALTSTDWTGARAHVRTEHWTIASKTITAFNPGAKTCRLNAVPVYDLRPGWGFFINNSLLALDSAGEWYYDAAIHRLYCRLPNNSNPTGRTIEGTITEYGAHASGKSHFVITGLAFFGQKHSGIRVTSGTGINVTGNHVFYSDVNGILIDGTSPGNNIAGNTIIGPNKTGILQYGNNTGITGNTLRRVAILSRLTASGMGDECCSGLGIEASGDNLTISGNDIDSVGYIGIRNGYGSAVLEKNFIRHCCLSKDDGGGIYCGWQIDTFSVGIAGTIIRNNIVLETRSANEGTPHPGYFPGQGIYIDDYGHDITIENNTAARCSDNGIFLHNTRRIRVAGNTLFDNPHQVAYGENAYPGKEIPMADNRLIGNRMVSLSPIQPSFKATSTFAASDFGTWDSNTYWNPFEKAVITYRNIPYTMDQWRTAMGQDAASAAAPVRWNPWVVTDTAGGEKVANGGIDANTSGWGAWPGTCTITRDIGHGMDGGCLKIYSPWDGTNQPIITTSSFNLEQGHKYLLRFSVGASYDGSVLPVVRQSYSPWGTRAPTRWVAMGSLREDYELLLVPTANDSPCRVDFNPGHSDSIFWLDNVSVREVLADTFIASQRVFLYTNPTSRDSQIVLSPGMKRLDGSSAPQSITLAPFASEVFYSDNGLGMKPESKVSRTPELSAFPNPFNPLANIRVVVRNGTSAPVKIIVYDIRGRRVADLSHKLRNGLAVWNAKKMPAGIYLVRLTAGRQSRQIKITLVK